MHCITVFKQGTLFTLHFSNETHHCAPVPHLTNQYVALRIVARLVGQHTGDNLVCSVAICVVQASLTTTTKITITVHLQQQQ